MKLLKGRDMKLLKGRDMKLLKDVIWVEKGA
jgi:hypothetical protein